MTPLPRLPANPTLPALSVTPQARPGLFKRAIAALLIVTINVSAMGQAAAQIIRGPTGAPLTGYTANGTYVQNGQVVGNPHQQLHDLVNPTLWTTAAASFTNSTDPSFAQGTLAQIEAAIAVTPEPGGLALSRLYITVPPAVPLANPYTDPNAGAAGCNAATTCNQAVYNQLLLDAQAGGYTATLDGTHIGKTHASSSPEIFNRGFNLYQTKPVFVAAENPAGGATAFFALQGEQAKTHLAHLQQQNAALLGSAIFFSQQRIRGPGTGTRTDWEGNVIDPGAAFDAALGSAPSAPSHGQYDPTSAGNGNGKDFVVGYIQPDGQAHEFQLQHDQHFREFQRQQNYGGWDGNTNASASELDSLLGQNLRTAGTQNWKGQQAAASIDFRAFKEDRALFMQGMDLHRHVNKSDWALLDGLKNGQITPGHPDYERARALSQDAFRQAYAYHTEYNTRFKHSKESAAYQAQQLDLKDVDDKKLFEQGFDLYDRKADARGEQLLRDLQAGRLTPGTAAYQEARALAEARFRVDYQGYLEPPKKRSWFQKLTDPATSLGKAMLWPKPQNVFDAMRAQPGQKQLDEIVLKNPTLYAIGKIAVTTVATIFTIGVGGAGAAATYDSYYTYAATGDMDAAHKVGVKSFATGVIAAGVTQGLGAGGMDWYTGSVIDAGSALQITQSIAVNTIADGVAQTIVHGGSFADNMQTAFGNSLLTAGTAFAANLIGNTSGLGKVGTELAHAGVGCAAGMVRSGSDGCAPGAVGAVAAHVAAQWFDPAGGRTLSADERYFYSQTAGAVGGIAASAVGGGNDAATNFAIGQSTGQNAVQNNYLRTSQISDRDRALQAAKTPQEREEINRKFDQIDQQQSQDAFNCVVKRQCASVLESASISAVLDDLNASCAPPRQCSPDAVAGIRELNNYYGQAGAIKPLYPVEDVVLGGALGGRLVGSSIDAVSAVWAASRGRVAGETAGSIRNVNPGYPTTGRTQNCVNCTVATDATLSGNPATALPSNGPVSIRVLEQQYGGRFGIPTNSSGIEQQLLNAGDGARGIVFGSRGPNEAGHVFNVVNQNGAVRFLDGQTGQPATFGGYQSFQLLRTNNP